MATKKHLYLCLLLPFLLFCSVNLFSQDIDSLGLDTTTKTMVKPRFNTGDTVAKPAMVMDSTKAKVDSAVTATASVKKKRHSPLKAALFSMALPGLGQGYNKKYWKIPIVYAGLGGLGYAVYYTASNFTTYRNAYRLQIDEDPNTYAAVDGIDDAATLKSYRDYYKRYLDISAICTGVWYALNIVDAAVDAHLFEWNMKDDLNVSWRPVMINGNSNYPQAAVGVNISLGF